MRVPTTLLLTVLTTAALGTTPAASSETDQRFVMTMHSRDGADSPTHVTATGPVQGTGTETQTYLGRSPEGYTLIRFTLHLPDGTLTADAVEDHTLSFDPRSCTATGYGTGTWDVVEGTGAYAGATGGGTFEATSRIVGQRDERGECVGRRQSPRVVETTLKAVGSVALP